VFFVTTTLLAVPGLLLVAHLERASQKAGGHR